ncbi:PGF-pre-PGF domain-containing protein [Candidatus Woesearchaeota archaeon]|nr:PGF-pre-PGF domain-containing protein [Candidatus Woesearchaeota archaeon]
MKKRWLLLILFICLSLILLTVNADTEPSFRSIKVWSEEPAGKHTFFLSSVDISITEVRFETASSMISARMIVESLGEKPSSLPYVSNVYKYLAIGKFGIDTDDIKNRKVVFRIEKGWVLNNSGKDMIKSYTYTTKWEETLTGFVDEDDTYYYYESVPDTFSYFAILGEKKVEKTAVENTSSTNTKNEIIDTSTNTTIAAVSDNFIIRLLEENKMLFIYAGIAIVAMVVLIIGFSIVNAFLSGEGISNIKEARDFIEAELSEGLSKKEVKTHLLAAGWTKKIVSALVDSEHLPPELEQKIKNYIETQRRAGRYDEEIKKTLLKQKWSSDTVESLMK